MRKFLVLLSALILVAAPAFAGHVQEPTRPVDGIHLQVLKYITPRTILPCDGSPAPTRNLRLEPYVHVAGNQADPSEHFDMRLMVELLQSSGTSLKAWAVEWHHSNQPPHAGLVNIGGMGMWRATTDNANTWIPPGRPGMYRVNMDVTTDVSGLTWHDHCDFLISSSTPGNA